MPAPNATNPPDAPDARPAGGASASRQPDARPAGGASGSRQPDGRPAGGASARRQGRGGSGSVGGSGAGARQPAGGQPARLPWWWLVGGVVAVIVAGLAGLAFGPVQLNPWAVLLELLDQIPGIEVHSGLSPREAAIVTELRLPRVCLGLLVGAMLAVAGGTYQGIFRNPLADPYLLGVAAGAGLGATLAFAARHAFADLPAIGGSGTPLVVPAFAFGGALLAVGLTYGLGASGGRSRTPTTLILAGVAVASFLTAGQTFVQQRYVDTIREVYSWIMGRLATTGWHDVLLLLPYVVVAAAVILPLGRQLDIMSVGDEEAAALGAHPARTRYVLIIVASLGTAAAVSVSGLIGFVGIIVPHTMRLLVGSGYRVILPLSLLFGAAFLCLADLAARTLATPTEIPIGVVTAFFGAPFFIVVLRTARRMTG